MLTGFSDVNKFYLPHYHHLCLKLNAEGFFYVGSALAFLLCRDDSIVDDHLISADLSLYINVTVSYTVSTPVTMC